MDRVSPKDFPCTRCGRPSYKAVTFRGKREYRCFPHANKDYMTAWDRSKLKKEMREILDHIDLGFPHADVQPWIDRVNDERELAFGSHLRDSNPARRLGLER